MMYALFKNGNPWKLVIYCKGARNSPGIYLSIYFNLGMPSISWERDSGIRQTGQGASSGCQD